MFVVDFGLDGFVETVVVVVVELWVDDVVVLVTVRIIGSVVGVDIDEAVKLELVADPDWPGLIEAAEAAATTALCFAAVDSSQTVDLSGIENVDDVIAADVDAAGESAGRIYFVDVVVLAAAAAAAACFGIPDFSQNDAEVEVGRPIEKGFPYPGFAVANPVMNSENPILCYNEREKNNMI